jgi:hypothetical protein
MLALGFGLSALDQSATRLSALGRSAMSRNLSPSLEIRAPRPETRE